MSLRPFFDAIAALADGNGITGYFMDRYRVAARMDGNSDQKATLIYVYYFYGTKAKVNTLLEQAGLQNKVAGQWQPTAAGRAHAFISDIGKQHSSGAPIQQVRWFD